MAVWTSPALGAAPAAATFEVRPVPAWVTPVSPVIFPVSKAASDGTDYLLLDRQDNLDPRASFYHEARLIYSDTGVQNKSAVSVVFDPTYEKLSIHFVRLIRSGVTSDRLDPSRVKLYQRETDLENFLYDGRYTAECQLEDVRAGDVIEYAYTLEGSNPVLAGHYTDRVSTSWNCPVHRVVSRVVYPASHNLLFKISNRAIHPVMTTRDGVSEWVWDESNIPARPKDPQTPRGYDPYGKVWVTDFADWAAVVDWALPLYQVKQPLPTELEQEIARLRAIPAVDDQVRSALRFVQDEIRYLGIEMGISSHRPSAPGEVLRRRFGDCKDKSLVLCTLLRGVGIEAAPALVNTFSRREISARLPAPDAFNHVIVRVRTASGTHWLDPTRSNQRGPLAQIPVGDYGLALVIQEGETGLTEFSPPADSRPRTEIVETYRIAKPPEVSQLAVTTEYRGEAAERIRRSIKDASRDEVQRNYLKFYARSFPDVQMEKPFVYVELPAEAGCRVSEYYRITNIWKLSDDQSKYTLALMATDLDNTIGEASSPHRDDPLAVAHPAKIRQVIRAEMFKKWSLESDHTEISNDAFHFRHDAQSTGSVLEMSYTFETKTDRVSIADLTKHNAAIAKIKENTCYTLTYRTPGQLAAVPTTGPGAKQPETDRVMMLYGTLKTWNWLAMLVALGIFSGGGIGATVFYFRTSRRKVPPPLPSASSDSGRLEGIGGWLLLLAFGVIVNPFVFISNLVNLWPSVGIVDRWRQLTSPEGIAYHPSWLPSLAFEWMYSCVGLILSVLMVFLFFRKRAVAPKCLIAFLIYVLAGTILDNILSSAAIAATNISAGDAGKYSDIAADTMRAAIWIPYLLVSQRVKATFRR